MTKTTEVNVLVTGDEPSYPDHINPDNLDQIIKYNSAQNYYDGASIFTERLLKISQEGHRLMIHICPSINVTKYFIEEVILPAVDKVWNQCSEETIQMVNFNIRDNFSVKDTGAGCTKEAAAAQERLKSSLEAALVRRKFKNK